MKQIRDGMIIILGGLLCFVFLFYCLIFATIQESEKLEALSAEVIHE